MIHCFVLFSFVLSRLVQLCLSVFVCLFCFVLIIDVYFYAGILDMADSYLHRPVTGVSLTKVHLDQSFPHWWHLPICFKRMGSFSMGSKDGTETGDSRSVGMNF